MNKKILLFSVSLGMIYLVTSSKSGGPATLGLGNLTGSPSSTSTCSGSGCHAAASASNTTFQIGGPIILTVKATGAPEAAGVYMPGTLYTVKLAAQNVNAKTKFGFQVTAVKSSDGTKAGTLTATSTTNTQKATVSGLEIIEQKVPIATVSGLVNITFEWQAPATGTGDVDFYSVVNAVNGNSSETLDEPSPSMKKTFKDKTTSIGEVKNEIASKIYPNPCTNVLNIEAAGNAKFMATVYDLAGRQVIAPAHQSNIDVSALTTGVYMLRLNTEDGQQTTTFVKQ